jgi:hypothetical protein
VIARWQLAEMGLGTRAIDHRIAVKRLRPVYRGVYTVGHRLLTKRGRWTAAVLASGPGAVLSHKAAAALWGIRGGFPVEVTVPRSRRGQRGIKLHRAVLPDDEITTHHGIPTTTVPRTLLDISAVVQHAEFRGAMRQAEQLRLTDRLWLGDLVERYPRKPGLPIVRAVVEEAKVGLTLTRSELEELFLAFLIDAGLPPPRTNVLIEGVEVRAVHDTRDAFELDRARDRRLEAAGWRVIRVTWRQLHDTPGELETELRRLLGLSLARA